MNAVEIEESLSLLASVPFDQAEFPFAFLTAFGAKDTTLKRLRKGETNASEFAGGLLWRNNIHLVVCERGAVADTLSALRASPKTTQAKVKFILATDGEWFEAEDLISGEHLPCPFDKFADHFGFLLPLAGISTIKELKDNPVDVRATGRLNKLYVELLSNNKVWAAAERRHDMNHFMARLIFCYFAEDTDIFQGDSLLTRTIDQMTQSDGSNVHEVLEYIFKAMNMPREERVQIKLPAWAERFPYVNGGLFSGGTDVPKFTRAARSFLIRAGELDWKEINPDIFGSMIQAVADDDERGALGMHYTSVPNILKVLNPLFLDDLRMQLETAGENKAKLLNLRKRMSRIRVFDPACGSGNFLVIAYKQMRDIEDKINRRRGEPDLKTEIPLTNFRGIELRDFPAEIARLALIIAEFQCDVLYRGQKEALAAVLPLDSQNWIVSGNALRMDWSQMFPAHGTEVKIRVDDLFDNATEHAEVEFENEGGETYICGNPPYVGTKYQSKEQKADIGYLFDPTELGAGNIDYVGCWFLKAAEYVSQQRKSTFAFVATTSLFQGEQAEIMLRIFVKYGLKIHWCYPSFQWANNASNNAAVICCIVGCGQAEDRSDRVIYSAESKRVVENIGPYLVPMSQDVVVSKRANPISELSAMSYGSMSNDDGAFTVSDLEYWQKFAHSDENRAVIKLAVGGAEFIRGIVRRALYVDDVSILSADQREVFSSVFNRVKTYRSSSNREATRRLSATPECFAERRHVHARKIMVPQVLSERREFVTAGLLDEDSVVIAPHMQIVNGHEHEFAILSSKLHHLWVATVCGRLKTDIRYSNLLGWNTFPVPQLTAQNRSELARCAQDILLSRESHYPATIAELYDPEKMPENLRRSHERNDDVLERIYVGRRFRNDTERLEKLFELYTKMNVVAAKPKKRSKAK